VGVARYRLMIPTRRVRKRKLGNSGKKGVGVRTVYDSRKRFGKGNRSVTKGDELGMAERRLSGHTHGLDRRNEIRETIRTSKIVRWRSYSHLWEEKDYF